MKKVDNMCDGLTKVHAWDVKNGTVVYRSSMLPSNLLNLTYEQGQLAPYPVIGSLDPDFTFFELMKLMVRSEDYADNTNIAVWDLGTGTATLTTESPVMNSVDPRTGQYQGVFPSPGLKNVGFFEKTLFSAAHFSRHPTHGYSINYIFTMSAAMWNPPQYQFYKYTTDTQGQVVTEHIANLDGDLTDMRLLHSFGVTENFIVVPRWNVDIGFKSFTTAMTDMNHLCNGARYRPDKPLYIDLISLTTGHVTHFDLDPQKAVHIMNSFERVNEAGQLEVVMDFPTAADPHDPSISAHCMFDVLSVGILENGTQAYDELQWNTTLRRFVMNLETGVATFTDMPRLWEPLDLLVEFPYINPDYMGKPYCFCYLQGWHMGSMMMGLIKYDVCREEVVQWSEAGKHASEPIFVPAPGGKGEDEGVIVAPVYDSIKGESLFYVWDAASLKVEAVYSGSAHVPYNIHGMWFNHPSCQRGPCQLPCSNPQYIELLKHQIS
eukprot:sb/3464164/